MKIQFDEKADAVRITFQDGEYDVSEEVAEGILVDITKDKRVMGIEILDASERLQSKHLGEISFSVSR